MLLVGRREKATEEVKLTSIVDNRDSGRTIRICLGTEQDEKRTVT